MMDSWLPESFLQATLLQRLRARTMVGFNLVFLFILIPLLVASNPSTSLSYHGMSFAVINVLAGIACLFFIRKTGYYKQAALFIATWCMAVSMLLSLERELVFSLTTYWLPFLLVFTALEAGIPGSLAFLVLTFFFQFCLFKVSPYFDLPTAESWPHWGPFILIHIVVAQLAFSGVVAIFEILRETDQTMLQKQKHSLLQTAKSKSSRALTRLMERKIQQCLEYQYDVQQLVPKKANLELVPHQKSVDALQSQLENLCTISQLFLDESSQTTPVREFVRFLGELLAEDPQFQAVEFNVKETNLQGSLAVPLQELYTLVELCIGHLMRPWGQAPHVLMDIEACTQADQVRLLLKAYRPQSDDSAAAPEREAFDPGQDQKGLWRDVEERMSAIRGTLKFERNEADVSLILFVPWTPTAA
jgi:hypothetical protein